MNKEQVSVAKLKEAIDTFDNWVTPARLKIAKAEYETLANSQNGQKEILANAANGDSVAADYLFDLLKKVIARAYWKYFLGPDKKFHKARIMAGTDKDFASLAYEMLLGGGDVSPYATFKPSKFTATADLLKQFGYYFYRYLQNEAIKAIRADKMGGMSGNVKHITGKKKEIPYISTRGGNTLPGTKEYDLAGDVNVGDFDAQEPSEDSYTEDSFTEDINLQETIKSFLKYLKNIKQEYYLIFLGRLKGKSIDEVARDVGVSDVTVRTRLKTIKTLYDDFVGD